MIKPMALLIGSLCTLSLSSVVSGAGSIPVLSDPPEVSFRTTPEEQTSKMAIQWISALDERLEPLQHKIILAKLYESRGFLPFWQDERSIALFQTQLKGLALAGISPFFSARYKTLTDNLPYTTEHWQEMDVLLTDTLLSYVGYLQSLPMHGNEWLFGKGITTTLPAMDDSEQQILLMAANQQTMWRYLSNLQVLQEKHQILMATITKLSENTQRWPLIKVKKRIIRPGYYYAQAPDLARLLGLLGDLPQSTANRLAKANKKVLSRALVKGVKRFQSRHGLKVDGVIGQKTYRWLALSKQRRLQMLALNGERMRLWQTRQPSMLIVNIPNFKLDLWLDNKHVLDSRVIVGKPTRPTPLMNTKMQSVVLNPHWNVPTSIMRKDIIPKAKYDRGYLSRNNFKIIRNWQTSEIIPSSAINWRRVSSKSFPYRLQQKPGKRNALGRYKFIIKNKQAIFLHDTPSKRLFNRTERALSSGCVRVQAAEKLASVLLKYDGFSNKRWNKLRSRRKTQTLPLGQTLPVQFIYQTAWVDKDNKIQYRNDIYDHDKVDRISQNESKITSVVKR